MNAIDYAILDDKHNALVKYMTNGATHQKTHSTIKSRSDKSRVLDEVLANTSNGKLLVIE